VLPFVPSNWITVYLENNRTLETAQKIAAHESPRTTKLYDRTDDQLTLDEIFIGRNKDAGNILSMLLFDRVASILHNIERGPEACRLELIGLPSHGHKTFCTG
jgi:hypothetical protein